MGKTRSAALLAGAVALSFAPPTAKGQVGGPCAYDSYPGACTIAGIAKTPASIAQKTLGGGPGYEGFSVAFTYAGEAPRANALARQALDRPHEFLLANGWRPGPRFLEKYAIAKGKTFDCELKVIRTGSCTPTLFEFPAIDQTDYFER